jgi:hypothetical protein
MDWILSGLVVLGNFMLGRKWKWGWIVMLINSLAWIYYALRILDPVQYGLVPSAALNFVVAGMSAYKWFKEDVDG